MQFKGHAKTLVVRGHRRRRRRRGPWVYTCLSAIYASHLVLKNERLPSDQAAFIMTKWSPPCHRPSPCLWEMDLILAAAAAYSFHCIRLEGYARKSSAVPLAASTATMETLCSGLALAAILGYYYSSSQSSSSGSSNDMNALASFAQQSGREIMTSLSAIAEWTVDTLSATVWGPAALAIRLGVRPLW